MNATKRLLILASEMLQNGEHSNLDDAIVAAAEANPELYRQSLEEGHKESDGKPEYPEVVKAALASLSPSERAEVERRATQIHLSNSKCSEADSIAFAMQHTPGVHAKCIRASDKSAGH